MKKEEKEDLDRQESSHKSLKRGIVAGAAGAAAIGAGYAAANYDALMADDESAEVIEDVDPADNEDDSFFGNMFAHSDNSSGGVTDAIGHPADGHSVEPGHAADAHGHEGFHADGDEPSVSVVDAEPDVNDAPSPMAAHDINADAVANDIIDDIPAPSFEEPVADADAVEPETYDPAVDF